VVGNQYVPFDETSLVFPVLNLKLHGLGDAAEVHWDMRLK
jgi:hypothetical protein